MNKHFLSSTNKRFSWKKQNTTTSLLFCLILINIFPINILAKTNQNLPLMLSVDINLIKSKNMSNFSSLELQPAELNLRKEHCLRAGYWTGMAAGGGVGILHTYWSIRYKDNGIPNWKPLAAAIPSAVVSTYVGAHTTRWMVKKIMQGEPKIGMAILKGAFYGTITGTVILASSYIPFFLISHYLDTIEFNDLGDDYIPLKLVGVSILGGFAYGGSIGFVVGGVAGPCISLYMNF